jgi:hypothetical protein
MGIGMEEWRERIASRSDLTGRLTHLTKPTDVDISGMSFDELNLYAVDNLIKILEEKKLYGSTTKSGYIVGNRKAVCFQDAPLYALIQNVQHEFLRREKNTKEKLRYCGVGLSFVKPYSYRDYGGRPVIYEKTEVAKSFLPKNEWWRIVDVEYQCKSSDNWDIVDWTHEREWRVPDDMEFDYNKGFVHITLYNPNCVKKFLEKCPREIINSIYGITTLKR